MKYCSYKFLSENEGFMLLIILEYTYQAVKGKHLQKRRLNFNEYAGLLLFHKNITDLRKNML